MIDVEGQGIEAYLATPTAAASIMCVRYWVLQQRLFGSSAQLTLELTTAEIDHAALLGVAAQTFILAHEAAHYVLGHEHKSDVALTTQAFRVSNDSVRTELEADDLAIAVSCIALEGIFGEAAPSMALAGAVIALAAVSVTERVLFIRRAESHPPSTTRLSQVLTRFPVDLRHPSLNYAVGASLAAEYGEGFLEPLGLVWQRGATEPTLHTDHPTPEDMANIAKLDQMNATSSETIADAMINRIARDLGVDLSDTPALVFGHDLSGLLAAWNVDELDAELVLDTHSPLLFFTLQSVLADSDRLRPIRNEELRRYIASMTALFIQLTCFPSPEFHT